MAVKLNATVSDIEKQIKINTLRKSPKRKCSHCNGPYFRRNKMEMWTGWNEGKRYGWHKDIAVVCLKCTSEQESKRIIGIADIQFGRLVKVRGGAVS